MEELYTIIEALNSLSVEGISEAQVRATLWGPHELLPPMSGTERQ